MPLVASISLIALGCTSRPLRLEYRQAQEAERGGHDEEGLAAWRKILAGCNVRATPTPARVAPSQRERPGFRDSRVRDDCGLAAVREAEELERLGRDAEAEAAWEKVPLVAVDPRHAARALARASELRAEKLADPTGAVALAERAIETYPDEVAADDALAILVRIERARDPRALRDRLDALAAKLAETDAADNLLFAAGELSAKELDDPAGAVARWDALADRYLRSGLRDDALWRAAAVLRAHGDPRGALARLDRILATRRTAWIVGSYNVTYLDDAQLLAGRIWLDDLHDPDRAATAFLKLADEYRDSTLRDDALLELARARLARHAPPTGSDVADACAALARLLRQFPDGNRARAARAREDELRCAR